MKEWLKNSWKLTLYVICGFIILSCIFWISNSFPRQSIIDEYLKKQEETLKQKYEEQINLKNSEIDSLMFKINQSEQQASNLKKQLAKIKKDQQNVQKPKDSQETIARLKLLGFTPK